MAGVTARKRGTYWEYRFDLATVDGKRKQHSKSGFRTKTEAMKAGNAALAKYNRGGEVSEPSGMSLADWMHRWLETTVKTGCAVSTYREYKCIVGSKILPKLGSYRLSSLTRIVLSDFVASLGEDGLSRQYIVTVSRILSSALSSAERMGLIEDWHRSALKVPKGYSRRVNERHALTPDEFQTLLDACPELYKPVLVLGWHTGMRAGEMLALRWDDVDFDNDTIAVRRRIYAGRFAPPKDNSVRTIRMGEALHAYLHKLRQEQRQHELEYGYYYTVGVEGDTLVQAYKGDVPGKRTYTNVVCRKNGTVVKYSSVQLVFARLAKETGISFDAHTLRHTHATLLLEAGVPPKAVQQRLGHKTIKVTMDIYAHVTERMQDTLVDTIDHSPVFSWSKCGQKGEKSS